MEHLDDEASADEQEHAIDQPMTPAELAELRMHRKNASYIPRGQVNELHEGWTDNEVLLLSPLWNSDSPLNEESMMQIAENHPVMVARPGQIYHRDVFYAYARFCLRSFKRGKGEAWMATCIDLSKKYGFNDVIIHLQQIRISEDAHASMEKVLN